MSEPSIPTDHEHFQINPGRRSNLPVLIAIHSTALGPAVGGIRIKPYARTADGMADCLLLSKAMTIKAAVVENGSGGGKVVVVLPHGCTLTQRLREEILLDVADQVHALDGAFLVAPDADTSPDDIDFISRHTPFAIGRSSAAGGTGGTTYGTFIGAEGAVRAAVQQTCGVESLAGRTICIVGLSGIGSLLAETFKNEGAQLILSDVDDSRRAIAGALGTFWLDVEDALPAPCDILILCSVDHLTTETVGAMNCKVLCGTLNGGLEDEGVARALADKAIAHVPDFIADAGGLMYASGLEVHKLSEADAALRVREGLDKNVRLVLDLAARRDSTAREAAVSLAEERLAKAGHPY